MPMYDWSRVPDGVFHAFHNSWITHLQEALNAGLLPASYYALGEQRAGDVEPDLSRQRRLAIRHVSGDRIVALVEIVSAANKHTAQTLDDFADKVVAALREGIHVLVIDPQPPTRNDPDGIHGLIWEHLLAGRHRRAPDRPLTLVSYCVNAPIRAYVEPLSVGSRLIDMPLFLTPTHYIPAPLESTYNQSWAGVPQRWRRVVED